MKNLVRAAGAAGTATVSAVDRRTRDRVLRLLYARGSATAAELAEALGLTAAGVRRHLDAMLAEGTLLARPLRTYGPRGRGRPARAFALSEAGHAAMPHAYDGLAEDALRFLAASGGPESVRAFARTRAGDMQRRYEAELGRAPSAQRTQALATALTTDGYAATVEAVGTGMQVCQHHCPVQHVAEQFPQLCEAETEVFSRLLGVHVQRLATIAHGDGVCTTHVPSVPVSRAVPARATTTQGSRRTKV